MIHTRNTSPALLFIFIISMLVIISDYKVISNVVGSVSTIIVLIYLYIRGPKRLLSVERKTIYFIVYFLVFFTLTSLFQFNAYAWFTNIMVLLMVFTPFFLFVYLSHANNHEFMKSLIFWFIIIWNIFLFLCFKTCSETPDLARLMTSDRASYINIINGGGYYMGYGSAVLATYFYSRLLKKGFKSRLMKLLVCFEIVFMTMTILVINSFIIFASLLIGIILVTINKYTKTSFGKLLSYSLVSVLFITIYLNLGLFLSVIISGTQNEFLEKRFTETYMSVVYNEDSEHIGTREHVYQVSIDGFLRSPIIGNGYLYGNVFNRDENNGVGNHSTMLDTLSQFGLLGGLPVLLFLFYPLYMSQKRKEEWMHLIPFYIMSCLNPTFRCYHVMLIVYLIIPSMQYLRKKNIK